MIGVAGLAEIANCVCKHFLGNGLLAAAGVWMLARRTSSTDLASYSALQAALADKL